MLVFIGLILLVTTVIGILTLPRHLDNETKEETPSVDDGQEWDFPMRKKDDGSDETFFDGYVQATQPNGYLGPYPLSPPACSPNDGSAAQGSNAGSPNHGAFEKNPQIRLTLARPCEVLLRLRCAPPRPTRLTRASCPR